jgi:hypothetical protein
MATPETESLDAQMAAYLSQQPNFVSSSTPREKSYWSCELILERWGGKAPPFAAIGRILDTDRATVKRNWEYFKKQGNGNLQSGRPHTLEKDEYEYIVAQILDGFSKQRPLTVHQISAMIEERWGKVALPDTIYHMLHRDERIRTCDARPMEEARLQVTDQEIIDYFGQLYSMVNGIPAHFVANMDEMGHQPFADAKTLRCFVSSEFEGPFVRYPVSRVGKRITLIAAVFADGSCLKPTLIIPRATYDDKVICCGYSREKVEIYTQKKGFIDQVIFEDWAKDVFAPEVRARRARYGYDGPTILILDNCSAHHGQLFERLCIEENIKCLWLPPHSSHLLQVLDLSVFGATKKYLNRLNRGESRYIQTNHIMKVLDSFHSASSIGNITSSFRLGGISVVLDEMDNHNDNPDSHDNRIMRCAITPHTARRVLYVLVDQGWRQGFLEHIGIYGEEESDEEEYIPDQEPENENVRAAVREIRMQFEQA